MPNLKPIVFVTEIEVYDAPAHQAMAHARMSGLMKSLRAYYASTKWSSVTESGNIAKVREVLHDDAAESVLHEELLDLWCDFATEMRHKIGRPPVPGDERTWSMAMISLADRIARISRVIGWASMDEAMRAPVTAEWFVTISRRTGVPL